MDKIEFKKDGYDPLIDYIKGLCVLFVIWTHCMNRTELGRILFPYWGDTAVPVFLLIQAFHYYKKGTTFRLPDIPKLSKRILSPYIKMTVLMFVVLYFIHYVETGGRFRPQLYWDLRGPGSYYIFIYLEFAFVIPLFTGLFRKFSTRWLFVIFVLLSHVIEFAASNTHCPDSIYRILFVRYVFLIYLGFLLATKGLMLNAFSITSGIVSAGFIYLFHYTDINMEPIFYTSSGLWQLCHWICYLYIAYILLAVFKYTYVKLNLSRDILTCIETIGKCSYEVYIFQIFYYATISFFVSDFLSSFGDSVLLHVAYIILSTIICLLPVIYKTRVQIWQKLTAGSAG